MSIRPLCPELAEKARVELNEDPKRIASNLQHIKEWLAKQPHLYARTDDQWLIAFLRGCKHSLERCKEKMDLYYSIRSIAPELFTVKHTDPKFSEILDLGVNIILPKSSKPDEPRVGLFRSGVYDPNKYSVLDIMAISGIIQKLILVEDDTAVIAGVRSVIDLEGATMGHFLQMTPSVMKKAVVLSQDALPVRLKGTHFINTPPGFETVFNLMKSLLNEKNKNRLYVHNKNYEELYKYVPKEILPLEYGGNAGTIREITDQWKEKCKKSSSWLEEDMKFCSDESKRVGQPKTAEGLFGVDGSFRQLEFD